MKPSDLDALLRRVARQADGSRERSRKALEGNPPVISATTAHGRMTPMTSIRTSTGGNSAGWRSSPHG